MFADAWTLWHLLFGVLLGVAGVRSFRTVAALALAWEFVEWHLLAPLTAGVIGDPSSLNATIDLLVAFAAWGAVVAWPEIARTARGLAGLVRW